MVRTVRVTPDEFVEKHARRTGQALDDMRRGIDRVDEAPGVKAAANVDVMRAHILESIDSGKWARRVASVSLADWKTRARDVGVGRVVSGLAASKEKVREFAAQLIEHENALLGDIEGMPELTLEDSIARATTWMRGMAEFERR